MQGALDREPEKFLSTPSARRATLRSVRQDVRNDISIHALREEGDLLWEHFENLMGQFLSTPSARRATTAAFSMTTMSRFLSTPSARRATGCPRLPFRGPRISIHALREEGDEVCLLGVAVGRDFYPRPPRGGRREDVRVSRQSRGISIHALREEGDRCAPVLSRELAHISIHALREEGDVCQSLERMVQRHFYPRPVDANGREACYFYPRPPRGGRPGAEHMTGYTALFLSTPSARRATPVRR